jgi:hypothetical protein
MAKADWNLTSETTLHKGKRKVRVQLYGRAFYDRESGRTHNEAVVRISEIFGVEPPMGIYQPHSFNGEGGLVRGMAYKEGTIDVLVCVDKWKIVQ